VIYENGALAGYSNEVTLLLYDNNIVYQENAGGGWWSWNGSTWVSSSDPRTSPSANGTTIPSATQIIDGSDNVWTVSGGVVYENGTLAGYSNEVTLLLYDNNVIYQENSAGGWWSWNGSTWISSGDPRNVSVSGACGSTNGMTVNTTPVANLCSAGTASTVGGTGPWTWSCGGSNGGTTASCSASAATPSVVTSANGTTIPSATQIIDSSDNVWTVSGGVVYENGALAGYSNEVTLLLYDNNVIYQENSAGGWWSWNDSTWVSSSDPRNVSVSTPPTAGTASLSWTAPTQNTDGTPLTDLAGYTIYYGTSPSDLTQTVQLADPSATGYVVSNLSAGTYYFAVAAYTTVATQSALSSESSKTIQ
jgi:hypothetical protein